jgi:hypothetical protein
MSKSCGLNNGKCLLKTCVGGDLKCGVSKNKKDPPWRREDLTCNQILGMWKDKVVCDSGYVPMATQQGPSDNGICTFSCVKDKDHDKDHDKTWIIVLLSIISVLVIILFLVLYKFKRS